MFHYSAGLYSDIYISIPKESPVIVSKIVTAIKEDRICLARARKKLHDSVTEKKKKKKKSTKNPKL